MNVHLTKTTVIKMLSVSMKLDHFAVNVIPASVEMELLETAVCLIVVAICCTG